MCRQDFVPKPQGPRRSSLVTRLVAHSRQFSPPGHLQAFAVSYSSGHRFALSRQRVDSGRPCLPDSAGAVRWRPFSRVATIVHRDPSVSWHIYMVEGDRHCLEHHRPSDAGNQCPGRALGSRRGASSRKAGAPNCPVALSRESLLSRNLEGQPNTREFIQPISSSACDCNHDRRGGAACLSQAFYRRHASNGCAYHSVSRRGWDWVAASRNSGRPPGTRARLARNHLLDQDP